MGVFHIRMGFTSPGFNPRNVAGRGLLNLRPKPRFDEELYRLVTRYFRWSMFNHFQPRSQSVSFCCSAQTTRDCANPVAMLHKFQDTTRWGWLSVIFGNYSSRSVFLIIWEWFKTLWPKNWWYRYPPVSSNTAGKSLWPSHGGSVHWQIHRNKCSKKWMETYVSSMIFHILWSVVY